MRTYYIPDAPKHGCRTVMREKGLRMRTMRGISNALVAALLALLLVAALPLAAAAEGIADSARGQRAEGAQAESGASEDIIRL